MVKQSPMTNTLTIDTYIQRSLSLFEASPSETKVSITYGSNLKKHSKKNKDGKTKSKKPLTQNFITFKTFEPSTGTCLRYKTYKVKEFSRLLSLLGPKSLQIQNASVRSIGSLMTNAVYEDELDTPVEETLNLDSSGVDTKESTPQPLLGKKNKKKNKNKKR